MTEEGRRCKFCNWLITGVRATRGYQCGPCEDGRRMYNMDRLQQHELLEAQGGVCLCCERPIVLHDKTDNFSYASIDHIHHPNGYDPSTSKPGRQDERHIRGVLCASCNMLIAAHEEDKGASLPIDYTTRVREYLAKPPMIYQRLGKVGKSIIIGAEK